MVGFYVDGAGNTDGFLATPAAFTTSAVTITLPLQAMPQGTVSLGFGPESDLTATIDAFGLTPGSSHTVELISRGGPVVQVFGILTANGAGQADVTLDSRIKDWWALGSKVEILNGTAGDPVSAEPIARPTARRPSTSGRCSAPTSDPHPAIAAAPPGPSPGRGGSRFSPGPESG